MTEQELAAPMVMPTGVQNSVSPESTANQTESRQPPTGTDDLEAMRRKAMMEGLRSALREPQAGEKRELAYLDKIECTNKGAVFFHMRTGTQTLKLLNSSPQSLQIRMFTSDLEGMQFGCGIKPIEIPAVVIYRAKPDAKAKTAGEIVSLDFVPKTFTLN